MDHEDYRQVMTFAFQDVRREICLAKASQTDSGKTALQNAGTEPGGGNFMAALALLCYTEFAGKLKFNARKPAQNFDGFFDELGTGYKAFRESHRVYDIFRCGIAHEYHVKKRCDIGMFITGPDSQPGIGVKTDGTYYFAVERYARDLERAFYSLEKYLFPGA
jgi:hypothetical protein